MSQSCHWLSYNPTRQPKSSEQIYIAWVALNIKYIFKPVHIYEVFWPTVGLIITAIHVHLWGFLITSGFPITNTNLILKLLQDTRFPKAAAITHCKGHQPDTGLIALGSKADREARRAATHQPAESGFLAMPALNPSSATEELSHLTQAGAVWQGPGSPQQETNPPTTADTQILTQIHNSRRI